MLPLDPGRGTGGCALRRVVAAFETMPSSPATSSSAQAARQRLADQLRQIREAAGLTGTALAEAAGWSAGVTKVSRVEHAARPISEEDLRLWCQVCGVRPERTEELVAELSAAATLWTDYRTVNRAGLLWAQRMVRADFDRARIMRTYGSRTVPGLIQTRGFTTVALQQTRIRQAVQSADPERDLTAAVEERMDRQRVLREGGGRFVFLVEEAVLRYRLCPAALHAEQLRHLMAVMALPSVSLGILPFAVDRETRRPVETFTITDDRMVAVEMLTGMLRIRAAREVAAYVQLFARLAEIAAYGCAAREIITSALAEVESS